MEFEELTMILGRPKTEYEGQINDFGGTKRYNNIPLTFFPNKKFTDLTMQFLKSGPKFGQ